MIIDLPDIDEDAFGRKTVEAKVRRDILKRPETERLDGRIPDGAKTTCSICPDARACPNVRVCCGGQVLVNIIIECPRGYWQMLKG